jgi:threonine synthase
MRFISTRGNAPAVSFSAAVEAGLAPDGGLYLPESLPDLQSHLKDWAALSYPDLCASFLGLFATDLDPAQLRKMTDEAYRGFDDPATAPLRRLDRKTHLLELFHGPTLAFKDFALQLLGKLYAHQIERTGRPISVLGATSGDTGAAAIHGLLGCAGVHTFILYPNGRVSPLQERQMTCTGAAEVFPLAIEGSFDDAQTALKEVFADTGFAREVGLSAVNSINLARILAQCVYYLYAWFQLSDAERANCVFVVPTGNFGNVLAGWLVRKMGVPIKGFRVATNQNDILHRLFQTGEYRIGPVTPSLAPSMDIQIASNFERFLYYQLDGDCAAVREVMQTLRTSGRHQFTSLSGHGFSSSRADDRDIPTLIKSVYDRFNVVIDPHTACAFKDRSDAHEVILATAHPAKFPDTIVKVLGSEPTHPTLEALKERPIIKHCIEPTPDAIKAFMRHALC